MTYSPKGLLGLLSHQAAGGVILLLAAVLAMLINNSPLQWLYDALLGTPVIVRVGTFGLDKPLLLWINDGLMAIFFFLVGLEIKKELMTGALSSVDRAILPAIGAVGGMVVPALIYAGINIGNPAALRGWAIPSATDIAFAVAVLTLLGPRVPASLKIFLLALAILDDLGAIVIIALFYTSNLSVTSLALAAAGCAMLAALNHKGITRLAPYLLTGLFIWMCVLKSGVHATLAGSLWRSRSRCARAILLIPRCLRSLRKACILGSRSACCRCSPSPMPACRSPASPSPSCSNLSRLVLLSVCSSARASASQVRSCWQ